MNNFVHGGDMPGLKALMKRMEDPHHSVLVGVPAGPQHKDDETGETLSMVEIAAIQEFGSPEQNIPERPVLRQGARRAMREGASLNAAGLRAVIEGKKTLEQVVSLLGVAAVGSVKREFVQPDPEFKPLSPKTIAERKRKRGKASTRPLVDTGQYRQSITYTTEDQAGTGGRVVT